MKQFIKKAMSPYPGIYNFTKYFYHVNLNNLKKFKARMTDSKAKSWSLQDLCQIEEYWNTRNETKNEYLINIIDRLSPSSILEIGCNCGNRLFALAKKFPHAKIVGIDINALAVRKGNEWLRTESITNVELINRRAEKLDMFKENSYDVVFSWAALIYIRPKLIKKVLNDMLCVSQKALILLEMQGIDKKRDPKGSGVYFPPGNWKRDYVFLIKQLNFEIKKINVSWIPKDIWSPGGGGAAVIEVIK